MSGSDIVKIFESIPQNETYSRYNLTLEKIFKSQSLRHFINVYKHRKTLSSTKNDSDFTTNVFGEELLNKKIKEEEYNDIFEDINEEKDNEKSESKPEEDDIPFWKKIVELRRNKAVPNLDPFKYHPNYNSIYKNIPSVKITKPTIKTMPNKINEESKGNKENKKYKKIEKKKMNKLLLTEINNTFDDLDKGKRMKERNKINKTYENINLTDKNIKNMKNNIKLPKLKENKKNKIISLIGNRNNHALRFSKYLPRTFKVPDNNKNISYINPFNYIIPRKKNKSIDFDKMLHRNVKNLVYVSSLKVPSFGQYNPKYNWIDKDKHVISFNPEEMDKEKHKKYLLKKICTSYDVNTEYEIVDNEKLTNK